MVEAWIWYKVDVSELSMRGQDPRLCKCQIGYARSRNNKCQQLEIRRDGHPVLIYVRSLCSALT